MTVGLFYWAFIQNFILGATIALLKRVGPNYLLAGVFALTGTNILIQYLFHFTNIKYTVAEIIWLPDVIDFLVPALLLLYLMRILNAPQPHRTFVYFLPAVAAFFVLTANVLLTPEFGFFDYIRTDLHLTVLGSLLAWKGYILVRSLSLLRSNRKELMARGKARYRWPKLLCAFLLASVLLGAINLFHMTWLAPYYPASDLANVRELIRLAFVSFNSIIVLAVLYYLVQKPRILSGKPILKPAAPACPDRSDDRIRLHRAFEEERIYLDNELNEKTLATHLDLPPYVLSRLLNEDLGKSFSTFVNEYRVTEAKRILRKDTEKRITNYAVALESGFRSESVFYVNFKKYTGTTPSKYRKLNHTKGRERRCDEITVVANEG